MKEAFISADVPCAATWTFLERGNWSKIVKMEDGEIGAIGEGWNFPIVAKSRFGSRGRGNTLITTQAEWESWARGKNFSNYIVETFHSYTREYRLHVTKDGCFYTCRKCLKENTPEEDRWRRHDDNCVWFVEDNPSFDKPVNWAAIVKACVDGLNAVGLDVAAFDVKVQSATDSDGRTRTNPKFIVLESNSAPSFAEGTLAHYLEIIPRILTSKHRIA